MATSLAAIALMAGGATAQSPVTRAGSVTPPPVTKSDGIGSRVVVYTKPSGEVRPVQGTQVAQPPTGPSRQGATMPDATHVPTTPLSELFIAPDKSRVFRFITDDDLLAEKMPSQVVGQPQRSILEHLPGLKQQDDAQYKKQLEDYERNPDPNKKPPAKPNSMRPEDLVVQPSGRESFAAAVMTKPGYMPGRALLEPGYVVHRRLLFEEKNSERYGWDLGMAQPFISAGYFYKDVLFWPAHLTSSRERYDVSAGKCPAGSPVPYFLYPPQITIRGGIWQAAAVVGVVMLLP